MISILIPVYNYDAYPLVLELQKQCMECKIDFEILCQDDASTAVEPKNQDIKRLEHCNFEILEKNIGRSAIRNLLAQKAQFENLLFLDVDTVPIHNNFIHNYITQINKNEKVVFGGIQYQKNKPQKSQLLRWTYGNSREALSVEKRKMKPNENALTSNLLIQKNIFISNKFDEYITKYGYEDFLFLSQLKKRGIFVKHINNPTYHMGLETSEQFLDKTKIALENLKSITKTFSLSHSESKIVSTYTFLKRVHLTSIISLLFQLSERKIKNNLLSPKPSLLLFDFYKIGYYCCLK